MGKTESILIIIVCLNIMLVIGGIFEVDTPKEEGGMITGFYNMTGATKENIGGFSSEFTGEIEEVPQSPAIATGSFEGFTDLFGTFSKMFNFLFDTMTAPFQLVVNPKLKLPFQVRMMFGLPLSILYVFTLLRFIRRGD